MSAHVDLFAGAGGWDVGARALGLDLLGVELDGDACATREAVGFATLRGDVAALDPWPVAGLVGSPPCQAWSKAGKRLGEQDKPLVFECLDRLAAGKDVRAELLPRCADPRSLLVVEPLRWALAGNPDWIALEQVPDVLEVWQRMAVILAGRRYWTWTGVLNAADYGVPQTRERAILIASRLHRVGPPPQTHSDQRRGGCLLGLAPWVSMAEALGWGLSREPSGTVIGSNASLGLDGGSGARRKYGRAQERGEWSLRQSSRENATVRAEDEPAPTLLFGHAMNDVRWILHTNRDQREDGSRLTRPGDEPAPALTGKSGGQWTFERPATTVAGDPLVGRPGHKNRAEGESQFSQESVRVTQQEAAILQDFPADFPFQGTKTSRFRQIGNAIPARLAQAVLAEASGLEIKEAMVA